MLATKEEKISCILAKHEKLIRESRLSLLRFTIYTMLNFTLPISIENTMKN